MRKLVLLMCFSVLTMYTFNISLFAEDSTASREQPVVSESGDKNPVVDTSDIDEDVEYVDDENVDYVDISMDATFVKDSFPSYNRAVFAFNDKLYYYFFSLYQKATRRFCLKWHD